MKKKLRGFTIIELIIVIAIIGILAAILIPSLLKSITKARYSTANSNAQEIYKSINNYYTSEHETVTRTPNLNTGNTPQSLETAYNNMTDLEKSYMSKGLDGYYGMKTNSDGYVEVLVWSKTATDNIIGRFPNASSPDSPITWSDWDS